MIRSNRVSPPVATRHILARGTIQRPAESSATVSPDATDDEEVLEIPEEKKHKLMMGEKTRTSSTTVLYFHGGQYYMGAWRIHRQTASKLAKACGGRALLVEYRLAPQTAFPGQLVDALNAYLYLIYPPEGSFHHAVPAGDIVIARDGAGGRFFDAAAAPYAANQTSWRRDLDGVVSWQECAGASPGWHCDVVWLV
ncbi:hypothetical protein Q7P35_003123 [Cladosporium inversicolor]